jgi:hypothetical protein
VVKEICQLLLQVAFMAYYSALKMYAVSSSITPINFYQTTGSIVQNPDSILTESEETAWKT